MNYKFLGNTGVQVSALCFGTMSFGGDADEPTSEKMYHRCREAGINFFDCANVYTDGRAEEILGKLVAGERSDIILTSKVYFAPTSDPKSGGASRRHIFLEVEKSLRRLQTEWIDVYFIHHFDEYTPLEETLRALDDLVQQGKILYPACSNFAAWQIMKALGISEREGLARFEVIQPMYSLVKRQAEVEIFPLALSEGLAVIPYSPLAGGLLTGKYNKGNYPQKGRIIDDKRSSVRYKEEWMFDAARELAQIADSMGVEPAGLAVAWVASHPAVTAPIVGARNLKQLEGSLQALQIEIAPELYETISALTPQPPVATDRSEERIAY